MEKIRQNFPDQSRAKKFPSDVRKGFSGDPSRQARDMNFISKKIASVYEALTIVAQPINVPTIALYCHAGVFASFGELAMKASGHQTQTVDFNVTR